MLQWRRETEPEFSIRKESARIGNLSHSLVSQVTRGNRPITRDRVPHFSALLGLKTSETNYLDQWVASERTESVPQNSASKGVVLKKRSAPSNHFLKDWLNVYVKDAFGLKGASPEPQKIHRALGGIAPLSRIQKSIEFLLKEGFLRRTVDGRIVKNDCITTTTDDIPDAKIRAFHKQALEIAKQAIETYPTDRRRANTLIMTLSPSSTQKLNGLLTHFYEQLIQFLEEHPDDDEQLYQVTLNLTPIGRVHEEK